jgi:release factor glutamine methyltransferase
MQLREALISAAERLTQAGIADSRKDAELLLIFALGRGRSFLYSHPEHSLTNEESSRFDDALASRSRSMPPQYITGHQEFWGMDLVVSPAVLIPRPETEHLVETVLDLARTMERPRIVDVGTGSGCIALALARELPLAHLHAVDISLEALDVARINAKAHHLDQRIVFQQGDLLERFPSEESFDFVVSNPPYIAESERSQLQMEVREFEPHLALFSGPSGFEIIERLIQRSLQVLKPGGWLVMEIGAGQHEHLTTLLGSWTNLTFGEDLQRIRRVAAAQRPPTES